MDQGEVLEKPGSVRVCFGLGEIWEDSATLLTQAAKDFARQLDIAAELSKTQLHLGISAVVIAGDILSAERATRLVQGGHKTLYQALKQVGSYSKLDWALDNLPRLELIKRLPNLWPYCDPDDTTAAAIMLWVDAWKRNQKRLIRDSEAKLPVKNFIVEAWRGQRKGQPLGLSWTVKEKTARFFQRNGGLRSNVPDGVILRAEFNVVNIMAYLTRRNEGELIIHPRAFKDLEFLDSKGQLMATAANYVEN